MARLTRTLATPTLRYRGGDQAHRRAGDPRIEPRSAATYARWLDDLASVRHPEEWETMTNLDGPDAPAGAGDDVEAYRG